MGRKKESWWRKSKEFFATKEPKDEFLWVVEEDKKKKCRAQHKEPEDLSVTFSDEATQAIQALVLLVPDTEFLCYLLGDAKTRKVTGVYVPKQMVSSTSVHMTEDPDIPDGIIGALHKHPGSSAPRFSCTDDEHLNVNHDISIVIPEHGGLPYWFGTVRVKHHDGCEERYECSLSWEVVPRGMTTRVKTAIKREKEKVYTYSQSPSYWEHEQRLDREWSGSFYSGYGMRSMAEQVSGNGNHRHVPKPGGPVHEGQLGHCKDCSLCQTGAKPGWIGGGTYCSTCRHLTCPHAVPHPRDTDEGKEHGEVPKNDADACFQCTHLVDNHDNEGCEICDTCRISNKVLVARREIIEEQKASKTNDPELLSDVVEF